jgi:capsular polysaccharide biosynthesis protein
MTNFFDNQNLLETLWKWKKHLIFVGILAVIMSAFFSSSLFIKPKYKSTARIYPSKNIYVFSDESESEQLLEIISAQDIKLKVIEAFDLSTVYKISKKEPQYLTYMLSEFNDNVSFKKTEYETVEISVLDTDPKRAATMCDSIIAFLDQKILTMHRIKYVEAASVAKKEMNYITHQIDSVEQKLNILRREYNIYDYSTQANQITKGMVKIIGKQGKNTPAARDIDKIAKNFADNGGQYLLMDQEQKYMITQLHLLKSIYDEAISGANKKIIYGQRVQNPIPADKKSYPIRSLIVFISTFAAIFVAILVVLFLENKKTV